MRAALLHPGNAAWEGVCERSPNATSVPRGGMPGSCVTLPHPLHSGASFCGFLSFPKLSFEIATTEILLCRGWGLEREGGEFKLCLCTLWLGQIGGGGS